MAAFTAKDVQTLREKTGLGMMECKKALTETDGDMEKAIDVLREKGLATATKKAGRIAAEGLVSAYIDEAAKVAVLAEVNSETDFVAKNADFVKFVEAVAKTVAKENPASVEALMTLTIADGTTSVEEALREKIAVIGENLKIRRFQRYEGDFVTYIHGEGRIGVMVSFDAADAASKDGFKAYAKDIAMQIAAASPLYVGKEDVPADVLDKEKEILTAQAMNEGKPAAIAEKMVQGRIGKYYQGVCLLEQAFIKDGDITVAQHTENVSKELGSPIVIKSFVRFEKGEGIEKREDNFADEVSNMIK